MTVVWCPPPRPGGGGELSSLWGVLAMLRHVARVRNHRKRKACGSHATGIRLTPFWGVFWGGSRPFAPQSSSSAPTNVLLFLSSAPPRQGSVFVTILEGPSFSSVAPAPPCFPIRRPVQFCAFHWLNAPGASLTVPSPPPFSGNSSPCHQTAPVATRCAFSAWQANQWKE